MSPLQRTTIQSRLPVEYLARESRSESGPQGLVLLLHGYSQTAEKMLLHCGAAIPPEYAVISLSGPFPIPERTRKPSPQWKLGYAWYFYDNETDRYVVDMSIALEFCSGVVLRLSAERGWDSLPLTIVGFSQGGYLAPFVGRAIARTRAVIGIGCRFREEEIQGDLPFKLDAIHGLSDETISPRESKESFERLKSRTLGGEWQGLEGIGHVINHEVQAALEALLQKGLADPRAL